MHVPTFGESHLLICRFPLVLLVDKRESPSLTGVGFITDVGCMLVRPDPGATYTGLDSTHPQDILALASMAERGGTLRQPGVALATSTRSRAKLALTYTAMMIRIFLESDLALM